MVATHDCQDIDRAAGENPDRSSAESSPTMSARHTCAADATIIFVADCRRAPGTRTTNGVVKGVKLGSGRSSVLNASGKPGRHVVSQVDDGSLPDRR